MTKVNFMRSSARQYHAERPGFRILELQISPIQQIPWHYHSHIQELRFTLSKDVSGSSCRMPKEEIVLEPGDTYSV